MYHWTDILIYAVTDIGLFGKFVPICVVMPSDSLYTLLFSSC